MRRLKPWLYRRLQARRWFRQLATRNFSSGLIALGEQNRYGIRPEWITVDADGADVNVDFRQRQPLPFPDASQRVIYAAHVIEHLGEEMLAYLLWESCRLLKPGGTLRLEAPDLERAIEAYRQRDRAFLDYFREEYRASLVEGLGLPMAYTEDHVALLGVASCYIERNTQIPVLASREETDRLVGTLTVEEFGRWCVSLQSPQQQRSGGHITPIYFEKLRRMLTDAGFTMVRRVSNGSTHVAGLALRGVERPHRACYSLYVEAVK